MTNNAKYVQRGMDLAITYDSSWEDELKQANDSKRGAPFKYAVGMIMLAAMLRTAYGFQYRQLSGFIAKTLGEYNTPDYTVLWRRINQLDVKIHDGFVQVSDRKKSITMLADSTGIKQANRGEWIRTKWQLRRGFVKIHLLADADTRKILAVMITDDKTGDSPMLKNVLGTVVRPGCEAIKCEEVEYDEIECVEIECEQVENMQDVHMELICGDTCIVDGPLPRVNSPPPNMLAKGISPLSLLCGEQPSSAGAYLLADGAYASRENMKLCKELGIEPLIPIQTRCTTKGNSTGDAWGNGARSTRRQSRDQHRQHGQRRTRGKPQIVEEQGRLQQKMAN